MDDNLKQAVKELQETLIMVMQIEKIHSDHIGELLEFRRQTEQNPARTSATLDRITLKLDEMTDNLDGLIGYVGGFGPPRGSPSS